jgi:flagellar hook-associated protein 3 FlgL
MGISVADIGQLNYINTLLKSQRNDLNTLQDQISSGQKANLYSELGGAASVTSISLHSALSQIDAFSTNVSLVRGKTSVMTDALTSITSMGQQISADLSIPTQSNNDPGMSNFNVEAQNMLNNLQAALNSQYDGTHVFAGTDISTSPVASMATLNTNVNGVLAGLYSGASSGPTVLTNVAAITGTAAGYSATVATAGNVTAQIDTNQTVDYTVKADDPSILQLMQGLSIIANLKYDPAHPSDFWTVYNGAKQMIDQGTQGVTNLDSKIGLVQSELNTADTTHQATQTTLQTQLGDVEDVDVAQATTQLQMLQTQLQASYKVVSMVNSLSLINYL